MGLSDKKYSALSQGSETSVGWHSRNLILGLACCRKVSLTTYLWGNGQRGRVQPQRFELVSREVRICTGLPILIL